MKQSFKEFINEDEYLSSLVLEMCFIMDTDQSTLNEMIENDDTVLLENVFTDLGKSLVHIKKGKGLIQHFKSAGVGMAKMFVAVLKGDTNEVKRIAKTVKATDVLDFLLKLDQATLHLITGPIHSLEAITGWHIWANIEKAQGKASKLVDKLRQAISILKSNIGTLIGGKKKTQYDGYLSLIDNSLNDPTSFINI